jgi:hypothetical protein
MTETIYPKTGDDVVAEMEATEVPIDEPEPWEAWESRLVGWSVGVGIVSLVVLGTLINIYILP